MVSVKSLIEASVTVTVTFWVSATDTLAGVTVSVNPEAGLLMVVATEVDGLWYKSPLYVATMLAVPGGRLAGMNVATPLESTGDEPICVSVEPLTVLNATVPVGVGSEEAFCVVVE
jgi:hypothetical protein